MDLHTDVPLDHFHHSQHEPHLRNYFSSDPLALTIHLSSSSLFIFIFIVHIA